jgi:hypothetical protein
MKFRDHLFEQTLGEVYYAENAIEKAEVLQNSNANSLLFGRPHPRNDNRNPNQAEQQEDGECDRSADEVH